MRSCEVSCEWFRDHWRQEASRQEGFKRKHRCIRAKQWNSYKRGPGKLTLIWLRARLLLWTTFYNSFDVFQSPRSHPLLMGEMYCTWSRVLLMLTEFIPFYWTGSVRRNLAGYDIFHSLFHQNFIRYCFQASFHRDMFYAWAPK